MEFHVGQSGHEITCPLYNFGVDELEIFVKLFRIKLSHADSTTTECIQTTKKLDFEEFHRQ